MFANDGIPVRVTVLTESARDTLFLVVRYVVQCRVTFAQKPLAIYNELGGNPARFAANPVSVVASLELISELANLQNLWPQMDFTYAITKTNPKKCEGKLRSGELAPIF